MLNSLSYEPDQLRANVDPERIAQVLTNLFSNSLRRVEGGGKITFSASNDSEDLTLTISDTGKYPFENELTGDAAIFDLIPGDENGQGQFEIGIALASALIEALGGTFSIRSEADVGTTFKVGLKT